MPVRVKARLRFQHDAQAVNVSNDVHPFAPGPLLEVGLQSLPAQQQGQGSVLKVFLLTAHGVDTAGLPRFARNDNVRAGQEG